MSVVSDEARHHPLYRVDETGIPCNDKLAKLRFGYWIPTWKEDYFVKVFHRTVYYKHLKQQKENEAPFSKVKLLDEDREKTDIQFVTLLNLASNATTENITNGLKEFGVERISCPKDQPFPKKAFRDETVKQIPPLPKGYTNDDVPDFGRTFTVHESPLDVVGDLAIDSSLRDHLISLRSENLSRMQVISINRHRQSIYDLTSTPTPPRLLQASQRSHN
ncbi:unnamed protein product [Bursaphelenchus xylophilus]|uniref:(pine wood nematode) hypothetical protein n=1 Tax=Bursaphelenchus xylophilus TaxID=6326 RepID=A0A1I7RZ36_BURXY|nr:unnamed protein product [Bursaphelenchus xylophilus]CAG9106895.1 unnamed protein product [Bursaphelenchus xylophilus]